MSDFPSSRLDHFVNTGAVLLGRGDIISKDDMVANPGPYPIYSSSAKQNGKFGEYGKYMFDEELVTWSVDGGGNFFYRPKHKYSVTNVCGYLKVKDSDLSARFIYYSLSNQHRFLTFDYTTKAHPSVIKKLYRLPHISKSRQDKIAFILQTIDLTIEKTEALIKKYQQIKAGLMHDLFTRGVTADGKLRPTQEQVPELYKETAIGWIPRDWDVKGILELADVIDPNPSHRNPIYHQDGFPFISTVEFIEDDQVEVDTPRRVIEEIVIEQERRCKFSGDSIAFSRKGTIGSIRFLPEHVRFALLDSLCVINPKNIDPCFLFNMLRNASIKKQIKNMTMGQALPQMSIGRVRELQIPTPRSPAEQVEIGVRLKAVSDYISKNHAELKKLRKQKSGLMHDLLTGKVPVKIEEPEAVHV